MTVNLKLLGHTSSFFDLAGAPAPLDDPGRQPAPRGLELFSSELL